MKKIKYPSYKRQWYKCPLCGTKLCVYDNTANLNGGIFIKCKTCKKEIEIKHFKLSRRACAIQERKG